VCSIGSKLEDLKLITEYFARLRKSIEVLGGLMDDVRQYELAWPQVGLASDPGALARVSLPDYEGRVVRVVVRRANGARVPVRLREGKLWPTGWSTG
jgi:hypothetical protein